MTHQAEPDPADTGGRSAPTEPSTAPSGGPAPSGPAAASTPTGAPAADAAPPGPQADPDRTPDAPGDGADRPQAGDGPTTTGGEAPRPGVKEQFGRTRRAASGLVRAHVDLLRAEMGEIVARLKTLSLLAGLVLALALVLGNLLFIGTALFLGEWLFGSIGWGLLHGTLLLVGVLTALVLAILGAPGGRLAVSFLVASLVGALVAVVLGTNIVRRGGEFVAAQIGPSLAVDPALLPTLVTLVIGAVLLAVVGLIVGARAAGGRGLVAGLVGGALLGALVGVLLGLEHTWQTAVALGVTVALLLWPILQVIMTRNAIAPRERFGRLWPRETYETALETKAWLGEQWANRRKTLARR